MNWPAAAPVLASAQMRRALVALSVLSGNATLSEEGIGTMRLDGRRLELIVARDDVAAGAVAQEASARVLQAQQRGEMPFSTETLVLSAGHIGILPAEPVLRDVSGSSDPHAGENLIEATSGGAVRFLDAGLITSGQLPRLAA